MRDLLNIRNSIIIFLCLTIIFMGIGFMVLSVKLDQVSTEVHSFDVSFESIRKSSSVKGSDKEPFGSSEIALSGKQIDMYFSLNATHDELVYLATIKNNGTIPAKIVGFIESPNYSMDDFHEMIDPVSITLSDIIGKTINPNEEIPLKITVYYNPSSKKVATKKFYYSIGLLTESVVLE